MKFLETIISILKKIAGIFCILMCIGGIIALFPQNNSMPTAPLVLIILIFAVLAYLLLFKKTSKRDKGILTPNIKQPNSPVVEKTNTIDFAHEITDAEIPPLIAKRYKDRLEYEKQSPNPKYHRTEQEEDLSFNFSQKYSETISEYENEMYNAVSLVTPPTKFQSKEEIEKYIHLCDDAIRVFEKYKKFCYGKGKGGTIYFQDMWEYLDNSKNPCFSYIDNIVQTKEGLEFELEDSNPSHSDN